jgi:hypothetical protein
MRRDSVVRLDSIGAEVRSIGAEVRIDVHLDVGERLGAGASASLAPALGPPRAGRIVGGRYELVRLLGRGSMGAVWLANHVTLGERVALKLIEPTAEGDTVEDASTTAARFRFEAQVAARLSRKTRHVVRVTDHGQEGPLPYLVMELLEGQTLEKMLLGRGPLGVAEVSALVIQIARGLEAAHAEGILHRDLKPANVFLADGGEGRAVVKLLDFGVARGHSSQRLGAPFATARGLIVGTPGYMSPEQAAASEIDVRSDLWSLAAIAYEALSGALPVAGRDAEEILSNLRACRTLPLRHHRPDLPEALDRFFERAFSPRIEARPRSCAELASDFEQAARHATPTATRRLAPAVTRRLEASPSPARLRDRAGTRRYDRIAAVALLAGAGLFATWYASASSWRVRSAARDPAAATAMAVQAVATRSMPPESPSQPRPTAEAAAAALSQAETPPPASPPPKAAGRPAAGELGEFKAYY